MAAGALLVAIGLLDGWLFARVRVTIRQRVPDFEADPLARLLARRSFGPVVIVVPFVVGVLALVVGTASL